MNIFFILFVSFFFYLNYLVGQYFVSAFSLIGTSVYLFWGGHLFATMIMFSAPIIYRLYPNNKPGFFYNALQWVGYVLFGLYSILLFFMFFNLATYSLYDYLSPASIHHKLLVKSFLATLSICASVLIMTFGFFEAVKKPVIKRIKIPIAGLPETFHGVTILQLSDVHVGETIKRRFVKLIVNMSNEISPDIVVLTGDMTDGVRMQVEEELFFFKEMKAPLGKFMVPGNHEYYWGVDHWIEFWRENGFLPLINEHHIIKKKDDQMIMAGVHDYSAKRINQKLISSPLASLVGAPENVVKILLAHQPRSIYEATVAGFDLQISGHTHSGQYFPFNFLIYLFQPFVKGLNRYKETWIYVNQGTGYWGPPTRFGVPPEITLIELIQAPTV